MWEIGQLSAKYESNGDPGAIGYDPSGGWSYGTNQIACSTGTFGFFLAFLEENYPSIYKTLEAAGGFAAASKGDENFKTVWKNFATTDADQFKLAQHDFLVDQMYGVTIHRLASSNIKLATPPRTHTLADVIFSMAVMAGPGAVKPSGAGCCGLIFDALCALKAVNIVATLDDALLIDAIYAQKLKRIDTGREYRNQPANIIKSVRNRVLNEHSDAVAELAAERGTKTGDDHSGSGTSS